MLESKIEFVGVEVPAAAVVMERTAPQKQSEGEESTHGLIYPSTFEREAKRRTCFVTTQLFFLFRKHFRNAVLSLTKLPKVS